MPLRGSNPNAVMISAEPERAGSSLSRFVRSLGPYQSLTLLLVPIGIVEPLKLVAVVVAGEGHWLAGTAMVAGAYAVSILVIERLFRLVKPKLLTLDWFARLWTRFVGLRHRLARWLIPSPASPLTHPLDRPVVEPEER
jgi:hypothetical protein